MLDTDQPVHFRPPIWLLYLALSVPVQLVLLAIFGLEFWAKARLAGGGPARADWFSAGLTFTFSGVVLIPAAGLIAHRNRVRVGPQGLEIRAWGQRRTLAWSAIEQVEVVHSLGWKSLRLRTILNRPLWLPRFVADPEGYQEAVAHFAGDDHPLARALATLASPSSSR